MTAIDDDDATGSHSSHNGHHQYNAMQPRAAVKVDLEPASTNGHDALLMASISPAATRLWLCAATLTTLLAGACTDDPPPSFMQPPLFTHCYSPMLFFGVGSAEPSQVGRDALARYLKKDGGICTMDPDPSAGWRWIVSGHIDNQGSESANTLLSGRRAQAVADLMIGLGVARENICVVAMGSRQPLVIHDGPESQNRRVQMIFTKVKDPCPAGSVPPQ